MYGSGSDDGGSGSDDDMLVKPVFQQEREREREIDREKKTGKNEFGFNAKLQLTLKPAKVPEEL